MTNRYLTTTLPYVNAEPHIGFAYELIEADALARFWRLMGHEVFFNTGTDEHGQKIADKAAENGQDVQAYVDHYADKFGELKDKLNLSYDAFIRTTEERHITAAQEMWKRCLAKGDIYKKKYSGLYCVGDEMFLKDSDLVNGRCPNHPNIEPVTIEEENYFFALSKYQSKLEEYLAKPGVVVPEWRRVEALNFVKGGLEDFSISRETKRMSWGVAVPDDETQVMYVWFDALTNYISTLNWPNGENFEKFWNKGTTLQLAGKDQVRFQSVMWQAMLMSADVKVTDSVLYHGFITSGGQKMSKSLGNVISPLELVERYGIDATRYLLLRHVHPFEDTDITFERLDEWYNAHLANGLGNLVARVMKLAETHLPTPVTVIDEALESSFLEKIDQFKIGEALDIVFEHVGKGDLYMQEHTPYKGVKSEVKEEKEKAVADIELLVRHVYRLTSYLKPFMPETVEKIQTAVLENKMPASLFARKD